MGQADQTPEGGASPSKLTARIYDRPDRPALPMPAIIAALVVLIAILAALLYWWMSRR